MGSRFRDRGTVSEKFTEIIAPCGCIEIRYDKAGTIDASAARSFAGSDLGKQGNSSSIVRPFLLRNTEALMLARLKTFTLLGIEAMPVDVEVDISPAAMPKTILVGLPDAAVKESTHRVERAIVNSGFVRPQDRVVINLAPGDLPKQAASFDLPVALGVLAGSGQLALDRLEDYAVVGELALEGLTRPIRGALSIAIEASKNTNLKGLVVPSENAHEAAVVDGIEVIPVCSLSQAVAFFAGEIEIDPVQSCVNQLFEEFSTYEVDFGDVRGQESAKRAMTLAAAGNHNLIMVGPPGSGEPEDIEKDTSRRSCRTWLQPNRGRPMTHVRFDYRWLAAGPKTLFDRTVLASRFLTTFQAGEDAGSAVELQRAVFDPAVRIFKKRPGISHHKVEYSTEREVDVLAEGWPGSFMRLFDRKSSEWSYEREHRFISHAGHGPVEFKAHALRTIVLGCQFVEELVLKQAKIAYFLMPYTAECSA